jgi:pimeloyl-ACP methyl ester carboxylesterase
VSEARHEGAVRLTDGRRLGVAEYGPADGHPVVWFHGTPGARRQIPPGAHAAADELDLRIVSVERPGVGLSTSHQYRRIADVTDDVEQVVDSIGIDRFGVVGLSGGGPYALACAGRLAPRVHAAAILGGVVPTAGPEACDAGFLLSTTRWFRALLPATVGVGGAALWATLRLTGPFGNALYDRYASLMPPGDQAVFSAEGMKEMFIGDIRHGGQKQFKAVIHDAVLFGRDWGFRLADVTVPVRWWHGDTDPIVPLAAAEMACGHLRDVELEVRPGESHLGGFAAAREVLEALAELKVQAEAHGA